MLSNSIINKAIDFILLNLENKINVDDVADFCGYSKFYFCHEFKVQTGESVYSFIKRMRLEQCAFKLKTEPQRTITEIGQDYGVSSSNLCAAFHQCQEKSPYYFRKSIVKKSVEHHFFKKEELESFEECSKKISVEMLDDFYVLYDRKIGSYENLKNQWCDFTQKYSDLIKDDTVFLERTFNDPSIADENSCMYDICMTVEKNCTLENTTTLSGGKFAVYHFKGSHEMIFSAYQTMFNVWIPATHSIIDNRYGFSRYVKINSDADYMEVDLCIPIK